MKQLKFYKVATWGLLILNLSMITCFFFTSRLFQGGGKGGLKVSNFIKLDHKQKESILEFSQQHTEMIEGFNEQQQNLLLPYFDSLNNKLEVLNSDSILNQIQLLEQKKIKVTYQHFLDIKSVLRPNQFNDFEDFMEHALRRIFMKRGGKTSPPKKE